jgi:hypothetical protein
MFCNTSISHGEIVEGMVDSATDINTWDAFWYLWLNNSSTSSIDNEKKSNQDFINSFRRYVTLYLTPDTAWTAVLIMNVYYRIAGSVIHVKFSLL